MYRLQRKHLTSDQSDGIEYVSCPNSLFTSCYILLIKFSLQYMRRHRSIVLHILAARIKYHPTHMVVKYRKIATATTFDIIRWRVRAKSTDKCIKFPYWYSHLLRWGTISFAHIEIRGLFRPASNTISTSSEFSQRVTACPQQP